MTPKVAETTTVSGGALVDPTTWQYWWENHKHDYVDPRAEQRRLQPSTPQGDPFLSRLGDDGLGALAFAPTVSQVQGEIVPSLLAILDEEKSIELQRNALISLAKIGREQAGASGARLDEIIGAQLAADDGRVREAAIVSLGLLGDWNAAQWLAGLLRDSAEGRALLGRSKVPTRTRAHAGYALGLLAQRADNQDVRRYVASVLTQPFPGERGAQRELRIACVTALGLTELESSGLSPDEAEYGCASECLESEIAWLRDIVGNDRDDDNVRAHAATALGRLAPRADAEWRVVCLQALLEPLGRGKRTPSSVRQSCVLALGRLGDSDDDRIDARVRKELDRVSADSDVATRQFALLSLAQVASRRGNGAGEPFAGAHDIRQRLLSTLARGKSRSKPWAALGLGLLGHHLKENGGPVSRDVDTALQMSFKSCKSPDDVGAYAIALALRGGAANARTVGERLEDFSTDNARGDLALACGMTGDRDRLDELRAMNAKATNRPAVLAQSSIALRLLGDRELSTRLNSMLADSEALSPRIAVTTALGQMGDRDAVTPLLRALQDKDRADHARAYAAMALGQVADRHERPWQADLSRGWNHLALASALSSGDGTGLLEMP